MQPENHRAFRAIETELRQHDPLETVRSDYDDHDLVHEAERDIPRIDGILARDTKLTPKDAQQLYDMGANLRLDWLYARHGGQQTQTNEFLARGKEASAFIDRGVHEAKRHEGHPQDVWSLQMKAFDVDAAVAHRFAREVQSTQRGNPDAGRIWDVVERTNERILHQSVALMEDMAKVSSGDSRLAQDARGMLYELMLLTYARWQVYESQSFDTTLVRSALSREDRPWNHHVYPKRAFDIVIAEQDDVRLLQIKNHHNDDAYEAPIQKIETTDFRDTLESLPLYLKDFRILLHNQADSRLKERYDQAATRLDAVFGAQLATA